jgi:formylglycine-generating enzyme required for sulfatase activity
MNPTDPNNPLRTTDHAPAPAASSTPLTADARLAPPAEAPTLPPSPAAPDETATLAPASAPEPVERVAVSGYEILGELGRGGMGVVYKARHVGLNRLVALKMVLAGGHAGPDELARFRGEAEAVARLKHPNVVQVYDVGESGGLPYFSLEYVEGGSLDRKLAGTPLPPNEAAALVETLARALAAAHAAGLVHRDLKPANILLTPDGTPKVTDFGLAKKLDSAGPTATGAVMGTPSYMAPEQAGGKSKEIGPATDVYALGAILYECLTGRPPFKAATPLDTILQVVSDEPVPPRQLNARVPVDLETVCLKCLQKEPGRRYAGAEALADDLRRFGEGRPVVARPVGRIERAAKWVKRNPLVTALLALTALLTVFGVTGITWKYLDAEQQKEEAQREADKAKKARDFLVSIFQKAERDVKGGNVTVRQLLEEADTRIPVEFAGQPELRAELVSAVTKVRRGIGRRTPQAMILEVRGPVQLQSATGMSKTALPQALVNLDDRLSLAADAHVQLVFLSDFHKEWLKPGQEVTIDAKGCAPASAILERDDSVLMTFVRLPKGTFYRGWNGKKGSAEKTEIKEDFEIAVHDVTQGQWEAIMGDNPSMFSRNGYSRNFVLDISDEELKLFPVEMVSWDDAQQFIKKLNEKEHGRGYWYRLPTEAEWEYACRGGATSEEECSYHFYFDQPTNDLSSAQANFNGEFPYGKALKGKYYQRTTRVGAYPANKLGLCDMHGNVYQWCFEAWDDGHVIRGGCWSTSGAGCRAENHTGSAQSRRSNGNGFRLARVPVR